MRRRPLLALRVVACAVACAVARDARAQAQPQPQPPSPEIIQYVTREGDTCPSVSQRLYGTPTRIDVVHSYNNLGAMPHRFRAGRTLTMPRRAPPARAVADGEVAFIRNEVHAYTPDDHRARLAEPLNRGHRVGTFAASHASVALGDERLVQLEEHTLVVLLGRYSFQTQRRETAEDTRLESGALRSQLAVLAGRPAPQPLVVRTPSAAVAATPGEAVVSVDRARTTRVAVHAGQAEVSARGRRVTVPAGFGNRTDAGRPPAPPRPLLPRPRWVQGPPALLFATAQGAPSARVTYAPAAGSPAPAQWRVQLARDEQFRELEVDETVDAHVTAFEARAPREGRYFARVRAVDADHFESQASEVQRLWVVRPVVRPSAAGRRAAVVLDAGLFCALDAGAFAPVTAPVELMPARPHTLRCADNAEGRGAVALAVSARESGAVTAAARVTAPRWSDDAAAAGTRELVVRVMDAAGAPLDDVPPTARFEGPAGTLGPFARAREPGTYVASLTWRGPLAPSRARIVAGEEERLAVDIDAAQPPSQPAEPSASGRPPRVAVVGPARFDATVGAGVLASFTPLGVGLHVGVAGRYRVVFGRYELRFGLAVGYERFGCAGGTAAPQDYCARAPVDPADLRVDADVLSLGVPVTFAMRFGAHVVPYVSAQPQLVLGRTLVAPAAGAEEPLRPTFGVAGLVGLQLEYRPHAPFVEVGYRYAQLPDSRLGALTVGGLQATIGYGVIW